MKARVRFSKQGPIKFVGHLDMVRYFQKVLRRADIDVKYSEGFSPHPKMSFASPLSVGVISKGEYFDIELNTAGTKEEMIEKFNNSNADGVKVLDFTFLDDNAKNAMSIISAADYFVYTDIFDKKDIDNFNKKEEINIIKKTKKSEKEVNIRPLVYEMKLENSGIFMKLTQGSTNNLKPQLVIEALLQMTNKDMPKFLQYERLDMYYIKENKLYSLSDC